MAFLGVTDSILGQTWDGPETQILRAAEHLHQQTAHPMALCFVLARLGVDAGACAGFLEPKLKDLMPDPTTLLDMDKASDRLAKAIEGQERVAIFADYDVDGATSAALIVGYLRHFGMETTVYVPDRIDEGYGPNIPAMTSLAQSHDLIICVDCGTLSHDAIAAAQGCDVVILDHHLAEETLPPALAVVNPNRQDETRDLAHLCAAAVVFLTLVATQGTLRKAGLKGPDLMSFLDLVALGTVADVAPLIGVNRAFVRQGLKIMSHLERPGIAALYKAAKINGPITDYHLGFALGPRLNAGGRVGQADLGAKLLCSQSASEAESLAMRINLLNIERRAIEENVRNAALAQVEGRGEGGAVTWAAGSDWHPGVVGIVASRLKEKTNRPSIVIGFDGDEGKGSGRSIAGVDLGALVQQLAREGLILKGGGHKMAAGLSLSKEQLEPAMARLEALIAPQIAQTAQKQTLRIDSVLHPSSQMHDLVQMLESAGPYGAFASAPRFVFADMQMTHTREVGTGHLKFIAQARNGGRIEGIAFGAFDTDLGATLSSGGAQTFHLAGRIEINRWGAREQMQLRLDDAAIT